MNTQTGPDAPAVAASSGVDALIGRMPAALTAGDLRIVKQSSKKDALLAELRERGTATTGELKDATGFEPAFISKTLDRAAKNGEGVLDDIM